MRIRWNELSPDEFEEIVAVLLSRTHSARRVDGSGGDGGRDCHFRDADGYHIFQIKSFTSGRLSEKGRKNQIKSSLESALKHDPDRWTLIVGLALTIGEQEWLDELLRAVEIETEWRDRTWLDAQLAGFPDIVRYYTEDSHSELLQQMSILKDEQTKLARLEGNS